MNNLIFCPRCDQNKPDIEFNSGTSQHGLHTYCRECQREYERKYWATNKDRFPNWYERQKERQERNMRFILDYLLKHPCVDCGETDPLALEFDHVKGKKKFNLSEGTTKRRPLEAIQKEIEKCVVRCVNCHSIKTAEENGYWILEYIE